MAVWYLITLPMLAIALSLAWLYIVSLSFLSWILGVMAKSIPFFSEVRQRSEHAAKASPECWAMQPIPYAEACRRAALVWLANPQIAYTMLWKSSGEK